MWHWLVCMGLAPTQIQGMEILRQSAIADDEAMHANGVDAFIKQLEAEKQRLLPLLNKESRWVQSQQNMPNLSQNDFDESLNEPLFSPMSPIKCNDTEITKDSKRAKADKLKAAQDIIRLSTQRQSLDSSNTSEHNSNRQNPVALSPTNNPDSHNLDDNLLKSLPDTVSSTDTQPQEMYFAESADDSNPEAITPTVLITGGIIITVSLS